MDATERRAQVAGVFDRAADTYDAVGVPWFRPIAERLVVELDPQPGERVLDVGCGRGAALFPLADRVGVTGRVTGIDLAPGMVAATARDAASRGLDHVAVHVMDAAAPDLQASAYDVIASSLVLFFLPDPASALAAWRPLLVRGGRLGVATFGSRDPRWDAMDEAFRPHLPAGMLDPRTSGATGPFASDEGVEWLFRAAGYSAVRTVSAEFSVVFEDADQWHAWSWSHGQRAMWEAVPEAAREAVRESAIDHLAAARDDDGRLCLSQRLRYTLAVA